MDLYSLRAVIRFPYERPDGRCAGCAATVAVPFGVPAVFVDGGSPPLCRSCTIEHFPALAALLDAAGITFGEEIEPPSLLDAASS